MGKRLNLEEVEQIFEEAGCKLLSKEYLGVKYKLKYRCSCGNISEIIFDSFKRGHRCRLCGGNKKLTFESVDNCFKDNGCILLETKYINNKTKMRYICSCGEESEINFTNFKKGQRCSKCGGTEKLTIEFAKQYFLDEGCELLETEYTNCKTKMRYICICGNKSKITFKHFKKEVRCTECAYKNMAEKRKYTIEFVIKCFKEGGCELLETEYINSKTKMKYICSCGDKNYITFSSFQQGQRCQKCGLEKISGKNNYNYNPNLTDEERINKRRVSGYRKWIKDTYKKDNYTCQKCEKKKDSNDKHRQIDAHHIESWGSCEELRVDKNNGITFCVTCHHDFHKKYGYGNNTREQLNEFLKMDICQK